MKEKMARLEGAMVCEYKRKDMGNCIVVVLSDNKATVHTQANRTRVRTTSCKWNTEGNYSEDIHMPGTMGHFACAQFDGRYYRLV